jgi:hypothetical protein
VDDILTLTFILLMAGLLWLTGAFIHWQSIRAEEKLADHLHRLTLLRQAELKTPMSLVGIADDEANADERLQPVHSWTLG